MAQLVNNLPAMQETWVQSLGWDDPPGEGKGYPLHYSGLENSMDSIVHGVAESDMTEQLSFIPSSSLFSHGTSSQLIFRILNYLLHYFPSLWKFFSTQPKSHSLVTDL